MDQSAESILLLDGATGTELDRRGADVPLPLWSAKALLDDPDAVEQVHIDYLNAGADVITTNTFRTHHRSLAKAGLGDRAEGLTRLAVDIARSARDKARPDALIFGSIAPLEDCYHPEFAPSLEECKAEHSRMIGYLLEAGVDYILFETLNTRHEALAAAEEARRLAAGRWILSLCMKAEGPPGVLLNGPPMIDILPSLQEAFAVGVNCMDALHMTAHVKLLRGLLPEKVRIAAYGNIGYSDDEGVWHDRGKISAEQYADAAEDWIDAGATIIGGCCGTTPETIKVVAQRLGKTVKA